MSENHVALAAELTELEDIYAMMEIESPHGRQAAFLAFVDEQFDEEYEEDLEIEDIALEGGWVIVEFHCSDGLCHEIVQALFSGLGENGAERMAALVHDGRIGLYSLLVPGYDEALAPAAQAQPLQTPVGPPAGTLPGEAPELDTVAQVLGPIGPSAPGIAHPEVAVRRGQPACGRGSAKVVAPGGWQRGPDRVQSPPSVGHHLHAGIVVDHPGAVALGGGALDRRSVAGHDDGRRDPEQTRRQGHGLRVIARGIGHHSAGESRRLAGRQEVVSPAKLEGSHLLERFCFQPQPLRRERRIEQRRSAGHPAFAPRLRVARASRRAVRRAETWLANIRQRGTMHGPPSAAVAAPPPACPALTRHPHFKYLRVSFGLDRFKVELRLR